MERHGLSQRRACCLVGLDRSSLRYQCKRPDDSAVRQRLRELAALRRRFGYRRLGWLLAREGHAMNHKKLYRLYHEEKLAVRRRGRRKRALGTRAPMILPAAINERWSLDFVADGLSDGRRFRILNVDDDFSRECLATVVDTSLGGGRLVRELERLTTERAAPRVIVSDNGTELTSGAVLRWATGRLDCRDRLIKIGLGARNHGDRRSLRGESNGDGPAKSSATAGYDRYAIFEGASH